MGRAPSADDTVAAGRAPLDRHALVWVEPTARERMLALALDGIHQDALQRWFANDWPLVVRRPDRAARADDVALGLALPPPEGKRRLCFKVRRHAIARWSALLRLDEAALRLPSPWSVSLAALAQQASRCGVTLRVFGSVAWQALTGLPYLTAQSDVDLWWQPSDFDQLDAVLALVARWEKCHGVRADGEIAFPSGAAVAWREWRDLRSDRVLAKRTDAAELVSRNVLAAALEPKRERVRA